MSRLTTPALIVGLLVGWAWALAATHDWVPFWLRLPLGVGFLLAAIHVFRKLDGR